MSLYRRAVFVLTLIIMITLSGCGVSPAKRPAATASAPETAVKVGDTYVFGQYEQDNDLSNGKEPIEWIVIDVVNGKALLLSRYSLDCQPYNESQTAVTWETCSLRAWLNDTFLNTAFSAGEQERIETVTVNPDKNPYPDFDVSPGSATTDKVFLLSITEADKYLKTAEQRKCAPTDLAISHGSWVSETEKKDGRGAGHWWLRTPGESADFVTLMSYTGVVYYDGYAVNKDMFSVRPALWVSIVNADQTH